jgi:RNA recognition motif-containing protein
MKLFVAKLNRDVQDEHLEEAFSAFGPVGYARVITDRDTGQSKCFGFVQMREAADGRKALEEMNGAELMGFRMVVKEAEDRGKKPGDSNSRGARPTGGRQESSSSSSRAVNPSPRTGSSTEYSRLDAPAVPPKSNASNNKPSKAGKFKGGKDIYADGPKPTKLKKSKTKRTDWLDDMDEF